MKNILAIIILLLSASLMAQKSEIAVQYNVIPSEKIGTDAKYNENLVGTFIIEYYTRIDKKLKYGLSLGYITYDRQMEFFQVPPATGQTYRTAQKFTVFPTLKYDYINNEKLKLGTSLGIGLTVAHLNGAGSLKSEQQSEIAAQLNLMEIKYGNKFGVKGALGFGEIGIFSMGLFYRL
jgi:hypothetical protein